MSGRCCDVFKWKFLFNRFTILWLSFIIVIYFQNVHFFHAQLGLNVCPDMKTLHISLNTAHSGCKPSSSISSFTHCLQVFLPLPLLFFPTTSTFLQANTQSSPLLVPNAQTISLYHASPPQPRSEHPKDCTRPHFTSCPSETFHSPHIHLAIIRSALSRLCRFSSVIALVSVPYVWCQVVNTLWTQALKIFPFCDAMHHRLLEWAIAPWT